MPSSQNLFELPSTNSKRRILVLICGMSLSPWISDEAAQSQTNEGNLGTPASVSSWYLNVIELPIDGGLFRSASDKPVPTAKRVPFGISTNKAPSRPLWRPLPGSWP